MANHPKAYSPTEGYQYQILCRNKQYDKAYDHCDNATDRGDLKHLLENYRMAYGAGWEFKSILLPKKYWDMEKVKAHTAKVWEARRAKKLQTI